MHGYADLGGAVNNGASLTITNCTFEGNSATEDGGAIYNDAGTVVINNSTFRGNEALDFGSFLYDNGGGSVTITNSTISGNDNPNPTTPTGFQIYEAFNNNLTIKNTIVSGFDMAESGGNCSYNSPASLNVATNYNISDDNTCAFGTQTAANSFMIGDGVSDTNVGLDPAGLEGPRWGRQRPSRWSRAATQSMRSRPGSPIVLDSTSAARRARIPTSPRPRAT